MIWYNEQTAESVRFTTENDEHDLWMAADVFIWIQVAKNTEFDPINWSENCGFEAPKTTKMVIQSTNK